VLNFEYSLRQLGDYTCIRKTKSLSGGSINQVTYVETEKNKYVMKTHTKMPENFFVQEALGLSALASCVRVPRVYSYQYEETTGEASLWLEWIPTGSVCEQTEMELGQKLAQLHHQSTHNAYGFVEDNYLGIYPQFNAWSDDWVSFFRDQRLKVQMDIGVEQGRILPGRQQQLENLMDKLDMYLPAKPVASLLHGDLWRGNWLPDDNGVPVFIDPSVSYGDREVDLAMTELFGGFPPQFYATYQGISPLTAGYEERKPIYQLYYLLLHLNYYGESYGKQVDEILSYYV
jgi:fructosamine-3-kinase